VEWIKIYSVIPGVQKLILGAFVFSGVEDLRGVELFTSRILNLAFGAVQASKSKQFIGNCSIDGD
jgi:hypothetical protein